MLVLVVVPAGAVVVPANPADWNVITCDRQTVDSKANASVNTASERFVVT